MTENSQLAGHAEARIGVTLKDKWRLDSLLGLGGMAAVYAATHRNGKRVAIKMLHTEFSFVPEIRTRFLREGYVANSIEHPGVITIIDDDTAEDGSAFLVMELLEGETLQARAIRKGGQLEVDEVLAFTDPLLNVLAFAHGKGVVHRDLKPENLFWTHEGTLKVLDFGIARVRELSLAVPSTRAGVIMGTPAFMAPEQARGRLALIDQQTDLWAVGATMFFLISGKYVHSAETIREQLALTVSSCAPSLATVVSADISPAVVHLVDRALAYEKDKRWPNAGAMQQALRKAAQEQTKTKRASRVSLDVSLCVDPLEEETNVMPSATSRPVAVETAEAGEPGKEKSRSSRPTAMKALLSLLHKPSSSIPVMIGVVTLVGMVLAVLIPLYSAKKPTVSEQSVQASNDSAFPEGVKVGPLAAIAVSPSAASSAVLPGDASPLPSLGFHPAKQRKRRVPKRKSRTTTNDGAQSGPSPHSASGASEHRHGNG